MTAAALRQACLAVHRYSGLAMLLFLGVAAITGCVLSFERPLDRWLNPDLFRPQSDGVAVPATAVAALERGHPDLVATYFPAAARAGRNMVVAVEPRPGADPLGFDQVFLDGGDGHVAGTRHNVAGWDRAHLVRGIYDLHYTLLAGTPGRWIMGVAAVAWLLSNLVGVYLGWPQRPPFWRNFGRMLSVRWPAALPRLLLDLHRASGLWLLAPLTVLAFTSGAMNFFSEALVPAVRAVSPPHASPFDAPPPAAPGARTMGFTEALAAAEAYAAHDRPGWRPAVLQHEPERNLVGVRFTRTGIESYRGLGPVTYWFDGADGRLAAVDDPYRDSAGQKLVRSLYPLHTGQVIGAPGVALDVVLGIATLEMSVTGAYLWLKRRPGRVAARRARKGL